MSDREKVLLVDDEINLLNGLKRQLRGRFQLLTAHSGKEALEVTQNNGPIAAVISDMRMPDMDGIATLEAVAKISPNTVRMMLTGNADQSTAVEAINCGHIFRFFNKPCSNEVLLQGIGDALRQHQLIIAEKEILEQTLAGSVKVLLDVIGMIDPEMVRESERVREWIDPITKTLALPHAWRLRIAAMLTPLGRIVIPRPILDKYRAGKKLSETEKELLESTPGTARDLLINIPRLREVAEILYLHERNFDGSGFPSNGPKGTDIPLPARTLRILTALARAAPSTALRAADFDCLLVDSGRHFDPELLRKIQDCLLPIELRRKNQEVIVNTTLSALHEDDTLVKDLRSPTGQLFLAAGTQLSAAYIQTVRSLAKLVDIEDRIAVRRVVAKKIESPATTSHD